MPEEEVLTRPLMNDLKKKIDTQMSADEVKNLLPSETGDESEMLRNTMICEPEIEDIQKKLNKHIADLEELAKSN